MTSLNGGLLGGLIDPAEMARLTAAMLLDIGAVSINARQPFTLTSGKPSPVYVDCRRIIAFPRARAMVTEFMTTTVLRRIGAEALDAVAGGETAGIAYAAWLADRLALPMLYVRKQPKGFGRNAQIEGHFADGARVLLVEDLATDGGSKLRFVEALRTAGARVADCIVVFRYGVFPEAEADLLSQGVRLHGLAQWSDILTLARTEARFDEETLGQVEAFLADPAAWQAGRNAPA